MSKLLHRIRQLPRRAWVVFAVAVIAAGGGLAWLNAQPASVSTDNASFLFVCFFMCSRYHARDRLATTAR